MVMSRLVRADAISASTWGMYAASARNCTAAGGGTAGGNTDTVAPSLAT
jgi:hypothetical protein